MPNENSFVYSRTSDTLLKHFDKDQVFEIEYTLIEEDIITSSAIFKISNFSLLTLDEQHKFVKTFSNGNGLNFDAVKKSMTALDYEIILTEELLPLIRILIDGKRALGHGKFVLLFMITNGEINPKHTNYLKTLLEKQIPYFGRFELGVDYDHTFLSQLYSIKHNYSHNVLHKQKYFHLNYDVISNLISFLSHYGDKTWNEFCDTEPTFKVVSSSEVGVHNTVLIVLNNFETYLKHLNDDLLKKLNRRGFVNVWTFVNSFIPELQSIMFSRIVELEGFEYKFNKNEDYLFTDEERKTYNENCPFLRDNESFIDKVHFKPFRQIYAHLLVEHGLEAANEFAIFYETKFSDVNMYPVFFEDVIKYYGTCDWESYGSLNLGLIAEGMTGAFEEWK